MKQVNRLIEEENRYYRQIYETAKWIVEKSGAKYSKNVEYALKRSEEMIEKKKRWKDGDSAFSNMVIEITVKKVVPLSKGQKITGWHKAGVKLCELRGRTR
jgi:hypothetical protein